MTPEADCGGAAQPMKGSFYQGVERGCPVLDSGAGAA